MTSGAPPEERIIYLKRFQGVDFDFQGKIVFTRYDHCEFVKCTLLIDLDTEQLAFTNCVFKDCNIDSLQSDEARGIYAKDNFSIDRWKSNAPSLTRGSRKLWPRRRLNNEGDAFTLDLHNRG